MRIRRRRGRPSTELSRLQECDRGHHRYEKVGRLEGYCLDCGRIVRRRRRHQDSIARQPRAKT